MITVLFPMLLLSAVALDAIRFAVTRRPWMATRLLGFLWIYLATEVLVMVVSGLQWIASGAPLGVGQERLVRWTYGLQRWWGHVMFSAAAGILRLRFESEGDSSIRPGPVIVFSRHASIVDTLLPFEFLTYRQGVKLRWVMKKELLSDPALDIGGNRLPNYFVDRRSRRPGAEADAVRALAVGMARNEGVVIFPEGTRFTPEKQRRAISRLSRRQPELHAIAQDFRHVLPPRLAGPTALLDAGHDLLVLSHAGLEGAAHIRSFWSGDLVGRVVRVRFWRIPASQLPASLEDQAIWLFELWQQMDQAVDELLETVPSVT